MSSFNRYSNSYFSDDSYKSGDFVLSRVSKKDLENYGIKINLNDFKQKVKKSNRFKIILTGGGLHYRKTKVYNFNDFII